jgi:amidohydrolase
MVQNLQSVVSRAIRPLDAAVVTVAAFHGGNAFNVIPEHVELRGTIRWFHPDIGETVRTRMRECVTHTAQAFGSSASIEFMHTTPVTANDAALFSRFERVSRDALGASRVRDFGDPVMGAEDFSFYGHVVPACFFALGLARESDPCPPLHDPTFDFRDEAIATGVETMVHLALAPLQGG